MKFSLLWAAAMIAHFLVYAQLSRSSYVYIHLDKTLCYPGDTLRFSGAIKDRETNLYCELYTSKGTVLIKGGTFSLVSNRFRGSFVIPKRSGYYWLVFRTINSNRIFRIVVKGINTRGQLIQ